MNAPHDPVERNLDTPAVDREPALLFLGAGYGFQTSPSQVFTIA